MMSWLRSLHRSSGICGVLLAILLCVMVALAPGAAASISVLTPSLHTRSPPGTSRHTTSPRIVRRTAARPGSAERPKRATTQCQRGTLSGARGLVLPQRAQMMRLALFTAERT